MGLLHLRYLIYSNLLIIYEFEYIKNYIVYECNTKFLFTSHSIFSFLNNLIYFSLILKSILGFLGLSIPVGIILAICLIASFVAILFLCCQSSRWARGILEIWATPAKCVCDGDSSNEEEPNETHKKTSGKPPSQKYSKLQGIFKNKSLSKTENDRSDISESHKRQFANILLVDEADIRKLSEKNWYSYYFFSEMFSSFFYTYTFTHFDLKGPFQRPIATVSCNFSAEL